MVPFFKPVKIKSCENELKYTPVCYTSVTQ